MNWKKTMITTDFLLSTAMSRRLYHECAVDLPIIDYHCHLDPTVLAEDRYFENLAQVWVIPDPYKHRAMRIAGVPEEFITGDASDREKFDRWAATVPLTLGNPLFHWTALELKRYFDIDVLLCPETADEIWETCNERLQSPEFSARNLLARMNVACLCTSDRLDDDLAAHARLVESDFAVRVLPSPRDAATPDPARLDRFAALGCRIADHAVDSPDALETMAPLAREYARRGWVMQLHLGAQRWTSSRLREQAGPAGGYACIGDPFDISALCRFFDGLERDDALPRTILFPANPNDYAALATLTGSFPPALQLGPAWWFNDHLLGMRQQLEVLASYGLLFPFVGMTTDSRSLLSMVRHEYFRRLFCDWIGTQVETGLLPEDEALLRRLIRAVCYENAKEMLNYA